MRSRKITSGFMYQSPYFNIYIVNKAGWAALDFIKKHAGDFGGYGSLFLDDSQVLKPGLLKRKFL